MASVCCVHNCPTYTSYSNLKMTYFVLPTDILIKQEWLKALNNLVHPNTQSIKVCELHFHKEDILRVDYTLLDGKLMKLNEMTTALKKTAIPCIFKEPYPNLEFLLQKENFAFVQSMHSYTLLNNINNELQPLDNEKYVINSNYNNNSIQHSKLPSESVNDSIAIKEQNADNAIAHNSSSLSQSDEKILHQEIHLMAGDKVQIINIKDFPPNLAGPMALRIKPVHNNKTVESTLEPVRIMKYKTLVKPFCVGDLKHHLDEGKQMQIQVFWRYIADEKGVLFFYLEQPGRGISKTVYFGENLKPEVRIANHTVEMKENTVIKNIDEVCQFLFTVGNMKVCDELFYPKDGDSSKKVCSKLFHVKKFPQTKNNRYCNECYEVKKAKAENVRKTISRNMKLIAKQQREQRERANLKSYCFHLKCKLSLAEKQMETMINIFTDLKGQGLQDELSFLPHRQREVIRAVFDAAGRQPGKRKFSDHWLHESLLLYDEGPKVYKYMRSNEILPLPSVDTLRVYNKKITIATGNSFIHQNQPESFENSISALAGSSSQTQSNTLPESEMNQIDFTRIDDEIDRCEK